MASRCVPEPHSPSAGGISGRLDCPAARCGGWFSAIVRVADDLVTIVSKADSRGEVVHYPDDRQGGMYEGRYHHRGASRVRDIGARLRDGRARQRALEPSNDAALRSGTPLAKRRHDTGSPTSPAISAIPRAR